MIKRFVAITILLCATAAWFAAYCADEGDNINSAWKKSEGFVAHEWGAIVVDERHPYSMEEDLAGTPAGQNEGVVKLEEVRYGKPVLFLYTDTERVVNVKAVMSNGGFAYYYPPALLSRPRVVDNGPAGYQKLEWNDLRVLPVGKNGAVKLADAPTGHWWLDCRAVNASRIELAYERIEAGRFPEPGEIKYTHAEQFLFYDGSNSAPVAVTGFSVEKDAVKVACGKAAKLHDVFVVVRDGNSLRWGYAAAAEDGRSIELKFADDFSGEFMRCMQRAGLYNDEAKAFWAAWEKQFSQNDGARVIYRLGQEEMDRAMPLAIEPKPDTLVRVNWVCLGK